MVEYTADEAYGFTYICQHGGTFDPTCQRELTDPEQEDLLTTGTLPRGGRTRMCPTCIDEWEWVRKGGGRDEVYAVLAKATEEIA